VDHSKEVRKSDGKQQIRNEEYPTNVAQLEREWRRYCRSPRDTLKYLTTPVVLGAFSSSSISIASTNNTSSLMEQLGDRFTERLRIVPEEISQLFCRVEMDASIFGSILEALEYLLSLFTSKLERREGKSIIKEDEWDNPMSLRISEARARGFTYRWIVALSQTVRFSLNVAFLTTKQRECVREIFLDLKNDIVDGNLPSGTEISYTGNDLQHLQNIYK